MTEPNDTPEHQGDTPPEGTPLPEGTPQVDSGILDPRSTWNNADEYDRTAQKLVQLFVDNFTPFADHVDQGVRDAAPAAA